MKPGRWEHFHHGADIGVRGIGPDKEEAFRQSALALAAVTTDPAGIASEREIAIECEAPDDEILLMDWLNALIYEMAVGRLIFGRFEVRLDGHRLHGRAWGEPVDVRRHEPAVEVKGATCTGLAVRKDNGEWIAECVVDV